MHPSHHAQVSPDRAAYIMASTGEAVTYAQLEARSNQGAHLFRSLGLKRGDGVVIFMENHVAFLEICWAAQRAGLYYTPISSRLTGAEVSYILGDAKAKAFITTKAREASAAAALAEHPGLAAYMLDGTAPGFRSYEDARDRLPTTPIPDQSSGIDMLYSSGTTGRPKGVRLPLPEAPIDDVPPRYRLYNTTLGFDETSVHLVPLPLYHALPLHHAMVAQNYGGTVVVVERFEAEETLRLIERHRVTHSCWVPTLFVRLLKLPEAVRSRYDLSSLRVAMHGAGPCAVSVKEAIIGWFGPVVFEVYSSTEGFGATSITSQEWLLHKGSVGRPVLGPVHIVDEESGAELPPGQVGVVYFGDPRKVEYLNDREKTAEVRTAQGWATAGDIGYLDAEGYLYLTDRKADMIISGGVNIYPREAENVLIGHPKVQDVAVFGVPSTDFGEEVKAVVQPVNLDDAGPALERELIAYCRQHLSPLKIPRTIDFEPDMPRHETGKLYKRLLKDRYWGDAVTRIA